MDSLDYEILISFIRGIPELVFIVSESGHFIHVAGVSEHDSSKFVGRHLDNFFPRDTCHTFTAALSSAFANLEKPVMKIEYTLHSSPELHISLKNNKSRTFELKINPLNVNYNGEKLAACLCRDITDQCECEKKLKELSERDHLTGLYNRNKLFEKLSYSLNELHRYGHPCSVLLLDLDGFKEINDTFGHLAGDHALQYFSKICKIEARKLDIFCRYGGDEFCFIMQNISKKEASHFAARLNKVINEKPFNYQSHNIPLSVSIGISEMEIEDTDTESVLNRADQDMYQKKHRHCIPVIIEDA